MLKIIKLHNTQVSHRVMYFDIAGS